VRTNLSSSPPKGMLLNSEMVIVAAGSNLIEAWSANNENKHPNELLGSEISRYFKLRRPTGITFDFENVKSVSLHRSMNHTNL
jgi:guanylate cyclase, other